MTVPFPYAGMYGPTAVLTALGVPVPSASVNVYLHGTTTAAALYTDQTATTTASNPVTTDGYGNLTFFAAPGQYDIAFTAGGVPTTLTVQVNRWYAEEAPVGTPSAQCYGATGTLVGGTPLAVPYAGGTLSFALGGMSLVSSPNNGFKVPIAGNYLVIAGASIAAPGSSIATIQVARNGTALTFSNNSSNAGVSAITLQVRASGIFQCSVNDIIGASATCTGSCSMSAADLSILLVSA